MAGEAAFLHEVEIDARERLGRLDAVQELAGWAFISPWVLGFSLLADISGLSAVGMLETFAWPGHEPAVASVFEELVDAAFAGAPVRKLYYERFDNDPDLLTTMSGAWELEATLPEFALIGGRYVDRQIYGLSRAAHEQVSRR